ncbi:MAG: hypothetical protein JXB19_12050 [Bacteroidales bacterium]|nr:hypothetical protein [Bacteroidales bacterium]
MIVYHLLLFISLFISHPLHVTITSVDIDHTEGKISVSHKFFTDDFSLLFYHLYEKNIVPKDGDEFTESELNIIDRYVADAFLLKPDHDSTVRFEYAGKSQNEDSVWLYFKGEIPESGCSSFLLTNCLMLDLYDDQTNLVIVAADGKEQGLNFDYRNREYQVELGME